MAVTLKSSGEPVVHDLDPERHRARRAEVDLLEGGAVQVLDDEDAAAARVLQQHVDRGRVDDLGAGGERDGDDGEGGDDDGDEAGVTHGWFAPPGF